MRGIGYEANEKRFKITILEIILHITENKLIIETSPFFYE